MIDKIWNIKSKKIKEETIDEISKEHHIPRVISTILLNRGIESKDIAPYLRKSMADIINPMLMLDMTLTELPQPHFYTNFYFHSVQMSNTTYLTAKVRDTV